VLVLVTDGVDNASMISQEKLIKRAQQSGVLVYAVGLLEEEDRGDANKAKRELTALAEATGGEVYFPKEVSEVEPIAHIVAHDIRNQYTIQYTPVQQHHGRDVSPDQDRGERAWSSDGSHAQRLLRHSRSGETHEGNQFPLMTEVQNLAAGGVGRAWLAQSSTPNNTKPARCFTATRAWWSATPPWWIDPATWWITLTQDAFSVFENNVRQDIKVFQA
jgi:hypothetical protein